MRVVFAGTPEVAVPSLQAFLDSDRHDVVAVVTRPDAPSGRGRHLHRSPVGQLADEHGIELLMPERPKDPAFLARLKEIGPDACPVVAYGGLLGQSALDIPRHGWINLHFSVLPAWRGAAPVQAAVRSGDEVTGASTFQIVHELDAGPVYGVVTETVRPDDTAGDLLERLAISGAKLLTTTLDGVEDGTLHAVEQAGGATYAPKVTVDDARVRFTDPAQAVDRLVRSVTPDPGAWAEFRGERFKLGPVKPVDADRLEPGVLRAERKRLLVGTATSPVQLTDVQAKGKKRMKATDWARGARLAEGERLT